MLPFQEIKSPVKCRQIQEITANQPPLCELKFPSQQLAGCVVTVPSYQPNRGIRDALSRFRWS
jgi:hypothetical protein